MISNGRGAGQCQDGFAPGKKRLLPAALGFQAEGNSVVLSQGHLAWEPALGFPAAAFWGFRWILALAALMEWGGSRLLHL